MNLPKLTNGQKNQSSITQALRILEIDDNDENGKYSKQDCEDSKLKEPNKNMTKGQENGSHANETEKHRQQEQCNGKNFMSEKKNALDDWSEIAARLKGKNKKIAVFLDYDGTLTPIVDNPNNAILGAEMRAVVDRLSRRYPTAIVTGRRISTIQEFVKLDHLYYAGSHGFDIRAPGNIKVKEVAEPYLPALQTAYLEVSKRVSNISGALVENNKYSISAHYRNVENQGYVKLIEQIVDEEIQRINTANLNAINGNNLGVPSQWATLSPSNLSPLSPSATGPSLIVPTATSITLLSPSPPSSPIPSKTMLSVTPSALSPVASPHVTHNYVGDTSLPVVSLCKTYGKKVFEIRPLFDWNKGKAVIWLIESIFNIDTKNGTCTSVSHAASTRSIPLSNIFDSTGVSHATSTPNSGSTSSSDSLSSASSSSCISESSCECNENLTSISDSKDDLKEEKDCVIVPVYIGDDVTDEDAFRVLIGLNGIGVHVQNVNKPTIHTLASHVLNSTQQVQEFLTKLCCL